MNLRQAAENAIRALRRATYIGRPEVTADCESAIEMLHAALAEADEPPPEPLTEDEVRRLYRGAWTPESEANEVLSFARAVERAHGIGGDE